MDTVVIKARKKSDVRLLHDFSKQIRAKIIDAEELEDRILGRIIEDGLDEPSVSESEVMDFLRQR